MVRVRQGRPCCEIVACRPCKRGDPMHPGPPVLAHGPPFSQTGLVRFAEELGEGLVEPLNSMASLSL